jgi:copper homeostasis protein
VSKQKIQVEVVAYNLESVRIAEQCGVSRIELCMNEPEGGTSPGLELLKMVKAECQIPVYVMVRPREGNFVFNTGEVRQMLDEIRLYKSAGANGIVSGCLDENENIDTTLLRQLVSAAAPLPFTFHRAFDFTKDPSAALEQLIACGCTRVLTSGQKPTAPEGAALIRSLVEQAKDKIIILPGSGINAQNVNALLKTTGCREIHLSAIRRPEANKTEPVLSNLSYSNTTAYEPNTDPVLLAEVIALVNTA